MNRLTAGGASRIVGAMQTLDRHGDVGHYVRPDRVYKTGVIVSTSGYQPNQDVQAVAASFTDRPMSLQLGAAGGGLFDRAKAAVQGAFAKARAAVDRMAGDRAMMPSDVSMASRATLPAQASPVAHIRHSAGMAYPQVGQRIAPDLLARQTLMIRLMSGQGGAAGIPAPVADAQVATTLNRWWNQRWNG